VILFNEAMRFKDLARDLAYTAMHDSTVEQRAEHYRLAREHELRAETYRAAAALIA
jgi:aminoglycoside phosphotransferase family enzyme